MPDRGSKKKQPREDVYWAQVEASSDSELSDTTQPAQFLIDYCTSLPPRERERYRCRLLHVERINTLLRDICFDKAIRDRVPKKDFVAMGQSFWYWYQPFTVDAIALDWVPEQCKYNRGLRWRIMGRIWLFLQEHIFDALDEADRNPLSDRLLVVMREIVNEKIKQFLLPFKTPGADCSHLDDMVNRLCADAKKLLHMLLYDNKAEYSFFVAADPRAYEADLSHSVLADKVQKVDLCGASHGDASRDVVAICMAGGLERITHEHGAVMETKALVLLYRPAEDESVPTNIEGIRTRDAMMNWGKLPAGWDPEESL